MGTAKHNLGSVFYVYCYEDAAGVPFYVGKGYGRRDIGHAASNRSGNGRLLRNKLKSMETKKEKVVVRRLLDHLTEDESHYFEQFFILALGRRDIDTGCLCNHTNGGEGTSGRVVSPSELERANIGRRKSPPRSKSGYKGVYQDGKSWTAEMRVNGKRIRLGSYRTPEAAAFARDAAIDSLFGEKTYKASVPPEQSQERITRRVKETKKAQRAKKAKEAKEARARQKKEKLFKQKLRSRKLGESGFVGVKRAGSKKNRWRASVKFNRGEMAVGYFSTAVEAAIARNAFIDTKLGGKGTKNPIPLDALHRPASTRQHHPRKRRHYVEGQKTLW